MEAPVVSNLTEGLSGPALNTQKEKVEQGPASGIPQGARNETCPEMHANEMHDLYDRHHQVSASPNPHQNNCPIILSNMESHENDK